jgi:hypothetical protein
MLPHVTEPPCLRRQVIYTQLSSNFNSRLSTALIFNILSDLQPSVSIAPEGHAINALVTADRGS